MTPDVTVWLVFARAAGLVTRAPGFSHPSVPHAVRAGLALALAFAMAPHVVHARDVSLVAFAIAVAGEVALGAAIGFGASLLYDGAYFAGRTIDDYLGVRGSVPGANVTNAQAFGRLWSSLFLLAFFACDGWVPLIDAFASSFDAVAPGAFVSRAGWLAFGLALPATLLRAALLVAAPVIGVAASVHLALAAATRVVPRLTNVGIAFPAVFAAALAVTVALVPALARDGGAPWLVVPWSVRR